MGVSEKEKVMYDAEGIVEYKTNIKGWVGKDGRFYGESEHLARYANSTHKKCECGKVMNKGYTKCDSCRHKAMVAAYKALEFQKWDGESPVCLYDHDEYFWAEDDIELYCEDHDIEPSGLMLMTCVPMGIPEVDYEYWEECSTEDESIFDFHPEFEKKVEELNKYIRGLKPRIWVQGKYRTEVNL